MTEVVSETILPPSSDLVHSQAEETSESKSNVADFSVKHPLQNKWSMWYDAPQSGKGWEDKLQLINSFETVEDFWRLMNNLAPPSKLQIGSNYHMFKYGVRPAWEDKTNEKGGKWNILVMRNSSKTDSSWLYSLLALIGEELDNDDEICGAVISLRRAQDKLAIWTKSADNTEAVLAIGRKLKAIIELAPSEKMEYSVHADAYSKNAKPRHFL